MSELGILISIDVFTLALGDPLACQRLDCGRDRRGSTSFRRAFARSGSWNNTLMCRRFQLWNPYVVHSAIVRVRDLGAADTVSGWTVTSDGYSWAEGLTTVGVPMHSRSTCMMSRRCTTPSIL